MTVLLLIWALVLCVGFYVTVIREVHRHLVRYLDAKRDLKIEEILRRDS